MKRTRVDEAKAREKLKELTDQLELLHYGGKVTSQSTFYNKLTGHEFRTTLNCVRKRLKKGEPLTSLGARQAPKPVKAGAPCPEEALHQWLAHNLPHIELVELGRTYSDLATFRRTDTGSLHTARPNRLKDKFRSGLQIFPTKEEIVAKRSNSRKKNGNTFVVKGKTLVEWAEDLGVGYSTFQSTLKHHGIDRALALSPNRPHTELLVKNVLEELSLNFVENNKLEDTSYRPDFVLPEQRLVVECDGLYWHSDVFRDKQYHITKRKEIQELGYTFLAFREDELYHKFDIVKSMLKHRLGLLPRRVFARKCTISSDQAMIKTFLDQNHLMGKGAGKCVALESEGAIVAAVQVKRAKDGHELSRFCTAKETSVVGGFSRLLKYLDRHEGVRTLVSFVDLRYGTGNYLLQQGFNLANDPKPSFSWTKDHHVVHRLQYSDVSAAEEGWAKLWDYGQALYRRN